MSSCAVERASEISSHPTILRGRGGRSPWECPDGVAALAHHHTGDWRLD